MIKNSVWIFIYIVAWVVFILNLTIFRNFQLGLVVILVFFISLVIAVTPKTWWIDTHEGRKS